MAWPEEMAERFWNYVQKVGGQMTYLEVKNLFRYIYDRARELGVDPETIDWLAELDPYLGYYENKEIVDRLLGSKEYQREEVAEEEYKEYIRREAEKLGLFRELEKELEALRKELERAKEEYRPPIEMVRKMREMEAEIRRLEEQLEKYMPKGPAGVPPPKVAGRELEPYTTLPDGTPVPPELNIYIDLETAQLFECTYDPKINGWRCKPTTVEKIKRMLKPIPAVQPQIPMTPEIAPAVSTAVGVAEAISSGATPEDILKIIENSYTDGSTSNDIIPIGEFLLMIDMGQLVPTRVNIKFVDDEVEKVYTPEIIAIYTVLRNLDRRTIDRYYIYYSNKWLTIHGYEPRSVFVRKRLRQVLMNWMF